MKACFPIIKSDGVTSKIFEHFGAAPHFLLLDTVTGGFEIVANVDRAHAHGTCDPAGALQGLGVDVVVVVGIGDRALHSLLGAGYPVYEAGAPLVQGNLVPLREGALREFCTDKVCTEHGHRHSSDHHCVTQGAAAQL